MYGIDAARPAPTRTSRPNWASRSPFVATSRFATSTGSASITAIALGTTTRTDIVHTESSNRCADPPGFRMGTSHVDQCACPVLVEPDENID